MKYRIEPAKGFAVCVASHVVKIKGKIVFRGSEDECHRWAQIECLRRTPDAVQPDLAVEGR